MKTKEFPFTRELMDLIGCDMNPDEIKSIEVTSEDIHQLWINTQGKYYMEPEKELICV